METYEPAPGSNLSKQQAAKYGPIIERLAKDKGEELEPEDVVEIAKPQASVLHDYFTWDNNKAAKEWRREQARRLMGAIIVVRVINGKSVEHRLTWNIRTHEGEQGYVPMVKVLGRPKYREQLIDDALDELKAWCNRNRSVEDLKDACSQITDLTMLAIKRDERKAA